jgi:hypothetical protein
MHLFGYAWMFLESSSRSPLVLRRVPHSKVESVVSAQKDKHYWQVTATTALFAIARLCRPILRHDLARAVHRYPDEVTFGASTYRQICWAFRCI